MGEAKCLKDDFKVNLKFLYKRVGKINPGRAWLKINEIIEPASLSIVIRKNETRIENKLEINVTLTNDTISFSENIVNMKK